MPAVDSDVYKNISKLFDSEGNPLVPSAYSMEAFVLINSDGNERDITKLVTSFNIIEELFSPVLICNINIRDDENLFEEHGLSGQEKLKIKVAVAPYPGAGAEEKMLSLEFFVKEYPNFRKTIDALNVQEYSMVAISSFAYISQLTRISKAIPSPAGNSQGNPILEIKEIFEENLLFAPSILGSITNFADVIIANLKEAVNFIKGLFGLSSKKIEKKQKIQNALSSYNERLIGRMPNFVYIDTTYEPVAKFKGNITLRSPLAAIEFLRTKAYDENLTPFFVYNRIGQGIGDADVGDTVVIQSLTSIMEGDIYYAGGTDRPYNYTAGFVNKAGNPGDPAFYEEMKRRILSVNANLKINKLQQASSGVFGNSLQIYDYTAKDYISKRYDPYAEGVASANSKGIISQLRPAENRPFVGMKYGSDISGEGIIDLGEEGAISQHIISELHLPPVQCAQDEINGFYTAPEIYANVLNKVKYYYSRLRDDQNIELEVYGDFQLNPGVKIELSFPKAKELSSEDEAEEEDTIISGLYLITIAIHDFTEGLYKSKLKCVKLTQD